MVEPGSIDDAEKQVAEFGFDVIGAAGANSFADFGNFFPDFVSDVFALFPVKTYVGGFFLNAARLYERG